MLFRLRDHPMFLANQPKRLETREISTTHFESWKSLRHNVAEDKVWIILGFSNLPGYVQATDIVIYLHFRRVGTWTICGQTLDFPESRECPLFVPLQRDQMANWKIMKSKFDSFLSANFSVNLGQQESQKEDKGWITRTKTGFDEDKTGILKTNTGPI